MLSAILIQESDGIVEPTGQPDDIQIIPKGKMMYYKLGIPFEILEDVPTHSSMSIGAGR